MTPATDTSDERPAPGAVGALRTYELAAALAFLAYDRAEEARELLLRFDEAHKSGVPLRTLYALASHQIDQRSAAVVAAKKWKERRSGILVLAGPVGAGKSVGAGLWASYSGASWRAAAALNVRDTDVRQLIELSALVLDEVGGPGSTTAMAIERTAHILARRFEAMRPTLVTTNLNRDDLARTIDKARARNESRLLDRVNEDGEWIDCKGTSRRTDGDAVIRAGEERIGNMRRLERLASYADSMARAADGDRMVLMTLATALDVDECEILQALEDKAEQDARVRAMLRGVMDKCAADSLDDVERNDDA